MTVLNEPIHAGAFVVSEANGTRSRSVVKLVSGATYPAGAVLGKVTASGLYQLFDPAAADGSQSAAAILFGPVDATAAAVAGTVVNRDAEINSDYLNWKAGLTATQKAAALGVLAGLGLIDRFGGDIVVSVGGTVLSFIEFPAGGVKATALGDVVVRIENDDGDLIEGDNTTSVTLAIKSGAGALTGGGAKTAVNGIVTWSGIQLDTAGNVVLKATAASHTEADTDVIVVTDE